MTPLLDIRDLSVAHIGGRTPRTVLNRVSLTLRDGEVLGVVGESGSGKSVLLAAVLGILGAEWRITSGDIRLRGESLLGRTEAQLQKLRGKELALALSNPRQHLNPILPVGRQIAHAIAAHRPEWRQRLFAEAADLLRAVGIPDPVSRLESYPHELSGGMCQRVILALAIANRPRLLMVDEPTSGLDVTISVQVLDLLRATVRELHSSLLIVSRDLGVVANYCQHVAVIGDGEVVENAAVARFFAAPQHPYSQRLMRAAAAAVDTDLAGGAPDDRGGEGTVPEVDAPPILELANLAKHFPVKGGRHLTAVNDVSFTIRRGEAVGLVGESGSGKTTVGRCILRLIAPSEGSIRFLGKDIGQLSRSAFRKLRGRVQMVFQDPFDSMDPRQRIGAAIGEPLALTVRLGARERQSRVRELLDMVGLDAAAAERYPHQMSAGELQRVGIARALATNPDLVVFDEPTSALDVSVRADILALLRTLQHRLGLSYLLISHDLAAVRRLCHRVAILYLGRLVEIGETEQLFEQPLHPYSRALLSSVLYPDPHQIHSPFLLSGEIPSPIDLPSGCALHARCPMAVADCARVEPTLEEKAPGRHLSCLQIRREFNPAGHDDGN